MKFFLTVWCLFLFSQLAVAAPFRVIMGMKLETLKVLEDKGGGVYRITVPKGHSLFDDYRIYAGKKEGVCRISAWSKAIDTSGYGRELLRDFNKMESALNKVYGKNIRADYLNHGSIWEEPIDWMDGLLTKERTLVVTWNEEAGSELKNNIQFISLRAYAVSNDLGLIRLQYDFSNLKKCREEINKGEDQLL